MKYTRTEIKDQGVKREKFHKNSIACAWMRVSEGTWAFPCRTQQSIGNE